MTQDRIMMG